MDDFFSIQKSSKRRRIKRPNKLLVHNCNKRNKRQTLQKLCSKFKGPSFTKVQTLVLQQKIKKRQKQDSNESEKMFCNKITTPILKVIIIWGELKMINIKGSKRMWV
jgi:hypothetical protein